VTTEVGKGRNFIQAAKQISSRAGKKLNDTQIANAVLYLKKKGVNANNVQPSDKISYNVKTGTLVANFNESGRSPVAVPAFAYNL
jgi:hypothetical protein